jgi:hypothetical protein
MRKHLVNWYEVAENADITEWLDDDECVGICNTILRWRRTDNSSPAHLWTALCELMDSKIEAERQKRCERDMKL